MKACVLHGTGDLRLGDLPAPVPGPADVLIRLGAGGICGSDLHYYTAGGVGDFRLQEPLVLGHEVAGEVAEVGADVRTLRPGDRVAVDPTRACGCCGPCRSGRRNLCEDVRFYGSAARFPHSQGAFAEFFVAPALNCHLLGPDIPYRVAACAEPLAVVLHAAERAPSLLGKSVFIAGAGPIGVLLAAAARLAGAARICSTDVLDEPLAVAAAMGATETANLSNESDRTAFLSDAKGRYDVAFEASGHVSGLTSALTTARRGGTVVQVGMLPPGPASVALHPVITKELNVFGSFRFDREYATAVAALASGRINVAPMLTHEFTFAQLGPAFATAADKRQSMKVSLRP